MYIKTQRYYFRVRVLVLSTFILHDAEVVVFVFLHASGALMSGEKLKRNKNLFQCSSSFTDTVLLVYEQCNL